jgi:hypothetical protein
MRRPISAINPGPPMAGERLAGLPSGVLSVVLRNNG